MVTNCYFLVPDKTTISKHRDINITYYNSVNLSYLDTRIIKHLIHGAVDNKNEIAKFLSHILVCKHIIKNKIDISLVSDFLLDIESTTKQIDDLELSSNEFNIFLQNDGGLTYLINQQQAQTIIGNLPYQIKCDQNYFYELVKSLFVIKENFDLSLTITDNGINKVWSNIFG